MCVSVSNPPQPNAGGGLRVTNPADLQRNGKQEPITKAPTPRRHTVTVGGMDLEMGQRANQVNISLISIPKLKISQEITYVRLKFRFFPKAPRPLYIQLHSLPGKFVKSQHYPWLLAMIT